MRILFITSRERASFAALQLELDGAYELVFARDLSGGLERLREGAWALVVLDHELGLDATPEVVEAAADQPVAVLSAHPTLALTLAVLRAGVRDVLTYPIEADRLRTLARSGTTAGAPPTAVPATAAESVIGESPAMLEAFRSAVRAAEMDLPVLIVGEAGTGKELFGRVIHENSARAAGPFVAVNCAAIPAHLLESELFGHEAGAIPNTFGRRIGRVQRAHGGTLFLDEIGALAPALQVRLMRLLQTTQLEPIGAETAQTADVRLIAATHIDLDDAVGRQRFRADLYYSLAGLRIELPPLRERGGDIQLLARHFLRELSAAAGREIRTIEPAALEWLQNFAWPGNIRQLRSVLARAIMLAEGETLGISHLPADVGSMVPRARPAAGEFISLAELERQHIEQALALTGGHLGQAARLLGIHRNTLRRKLEVYHLPHR